jgi:phage N-6-adenine-methyltransferase
VSDQRSADAIRTGPTVRRGKSKQDYGTPREFIDAVERRFGAFSWDLACTSENAKAQLGFIWPECDSLQQNWRDLTGNLWLNPPFANIEPWAEKLAKECAWRQAFAFLLVPASIGSAWFADHVRDFSVVLGLAPRMTFEGETDPYPKDLMLAVYGFGLKGFGTWRWK